MSVKERWTPLGTDQAVSLLVVEDDPHSQEAIDFLKSRNVSVEVIRVWADTAQRARLPRLVTSRGRYSGLAAIRRVVEFSLARQP